MSNFTGHAAAIAAIAAAVKIIFCTVAPIVANGLTLLANVAAVVKSREISASAPIIQKPTLPQYVYKPMQKKMKLENRPNMDLKVDPLKDTIDQLVSHLGENNEATQNLKQNHYSDLRSMPNTLNHLMKYVQRSDRKQVVQFLKKNVSNKINKEFLEILIQSFSDQKSHDDPCIEMIFDLINNYIVSASFVQKTMQELRQKKQISDDQYYQLSRLLK